MADPVFFETPVGDLALPRLGTPYMPLSAPREVSSKFTATLLLDAEDAYGITSFPEDHFDYWLRMPVRLIPEDRRLTRYNTEKSYALSASAPAHKPPAIVSKFGLHQRTPSMLEVLQPGDRVVFGVEFVRYEVQDLRGVAAVLQYVREVT
jgi:hypothetical protein